MVQRIVDARARVEHPGRAQTTSSRSWWLAMTAVALAVAAGCDHRDDERKSSSSPGAHRDTAAGLRVLTYNVYVANRDVPGTVARIAAADADVVLLQEVTPGFEAVVREQLGDRYPHMAFHLSRIGNGPGVLSRVPWSSPAYVASTRGLNGWWRGRFEVGGRSLVLVDVHLHPTLVAGLGPIAAGREYQAAERARQAQVDELTAGLDADVPTALVGDFNAFGTSPTLARLGALGWSDGLAGSPVADTPTFQYQGLGFQIDHVLIPRQLVCRDAAVLDGGTSDHDAVVVTLAWAPG